MTPERIAELRQWIEWNCFRACDMAEVLDEVERLQALVHVAEKVLPINKAKIERLQAQLASWEIE